VTLKRVITEFGTGNDLHGGDYTKAAVRAVEDAIHHSSLSLIRSLGIDSAALPHGQISVTVLKGGLDVPDEAAGDVAIIASAAVTVRLDLP